MASNIMLNTTPLAISSLFNFSNPKKVIRLKTAPRVIILPSFPSDFKIVKPLRKGKAVNSSIKRKHPIKVVAIPIPIP